MKHQILAASLLLVSLAGCVGPPGQSGSPAASALAEIEWALFRLVSVSVTEAYEGTASGEVVAKRSAIYSYVSTALLEAKEIRIAPDGTATVRTFAVSAAIADALPPIPLPLSPDRRDATDALLSLAASLAPPRENGVRLNYWIHAVGGATKIVHTQEGRGDPGVRRIIDAATGLISSPDPDPPAPGIPTADRLDFGHAEAQGPGAMEASLWAPDAQLIMIATKERNQGTGLIAASFGSHPFAGLQPNLGGTFYPPDVESVDGKAGVWGFLYYSPSRHELLPVYVYSGILAVPGPSVAAMGSANDYSYVLGQYQPAENATTLVSSAVYRETPVQYYLARHDLGHSWHLRWSTEDILIMDAEPQPRNPRVCPIYVCG